MAPTPHQCLDTASKVCIGFLPPKDNDYNVLCISRYGKSCTAMICVQIVTIGESRSRKRLVPIMKG